MTKILVTFMLVVTILAGSAPGFASGNFNTSGPVAGGTDVSGGAGTVANGTTGSMTSAPGGGSGGTCDFEAIKKSIKGTESGANARCDTFSKCGNAKKHGSACGIYQFIPATWASMSRSCAGSSNCPHNDMVKASCCGVQECAMNNLLAANMNGIKKRASCQQIMGKTIRSPKYGSCTVTMSGLLAAWHLGGNNACDGPARGTYGDTDGHTTEADYICKHGGKPVPNDCTPAQQGDPNAEPPVGTEQQIEVREGQGESFSTGCTNCLTDWWVAGLQLMAQQFTINMVKQVEMIGTLLDAKQQLETQRVMQEKMAEAHKDYSPSEQVCTFATFARDLAATQQNAEVTKRSVANEIMQRELGSGDTKGVTSVSDSLSRISMFRRRFCSPTDNGNGLTNLCPNPAPAEMQNRDINYTTTLDLPLSLRIDMTDSETTPDEEAVFALIDNLFAHDPSLRIPASSLEMAKFQYHYLNFRSIVAMRGIARNTIANLVALKTETPNKASGTPGSSSYMRRLLLEFGMDETEVQTYLGENPSYYAQMEMLTKKLYQNPTFYAQLYDKPANVARMRAAMSAIKLMQDRDIEAAMHRREMLLSIMLELRVRERANRVYNDVERAIYTEQ